MSDTTITTADGQMRIEWNDRARWLLTTRVHTDPDLLDQLKFALKADRIILSQGGYNFYIAFDHPPRMSDEQMLAIAAEVVNDFYADPAPFVVAYDGEHNRLDCLCPTIELRLNRRFEEATRGAIEEALCRLHGVAEASFYYGGNRLWVRLPNHLFDIDEMAQAAIQVVTDYGKIFDSTP